ncbi:MAG: ABC transporter permease [Tissierellia bacterium]|nr:ABC transporter permease [Tissierellia bacterium]
MGALSFVSSLKNIKRNALMSFASIFSITSTLIILGIVIALILNVNHLTDEFVDKFNILNLQISDDYSDGDIEELEAKISSMDNIKSVTLITKEEALEKMKKDFEGHSETLEGLPENPMPNVLRIELKDVEQAEATIVKLEEIDKDNEIHYYRDTVNKILNITDVIKTVGMVLILILLITTVFVVNNTIRVSIAGRRTEIGIMRYVGATRGFIRRPYLVEGIILGLLGAVISTALINFGYDKFIGMTLSSLSQLGQDKPFLDTLYIVKRVGFLAVIIGIGVGMVGSIFSVRKYLRV